MTLYGPSAKDRAVTRSRAGDVGRAGSGSGNIRLALSINEAACAIGCSRAWLYRWGLQTGELASIRLGRRVVIPVAALGAFLRARLVDPDDTMPDLLDIALVASSVPEDEAVCRECGSSIAPERWHAASIVGADGHDQDATVRPHAARRGPATPRVSGHRLPSTRTLKRDRQ